MLRRQFKNEKLHTSNFVRGYLYGMISCFKGHLTFEICVCFEYIIKTFVVEKIVKLSVSFHTRQ